MTRLLALLRKTKARAVVLWGPPGVGKTAIAEQLRPAERLIKPDVAALDAKLRALPRGRWTLLDDVPEPARLLERVAKLKSGARLLITCRARPTGVPSLEEVGVKKAAALVALEVEPLPLPEAVALYETVALAHGTEPVALERARPMTRRLVEQVDRLPRCIEGLAQLAGLSPPGDLTHFVDALPEDEALARLLPVEDAWRQLSPVAQQVAMAVSVFPSRFQVAQVTAVVGDARQALSGLRELENVGLLARPTVKQPGVVLWFPVKRAARRALLASGGEAEVVERALADAAGRTGLDVEPWAPLARERRSPSLVPLLERGAKEALAAGKTALACQLLDAVLDPEEVLPEPEGRARLLVVRSEVRSRLGWSADALGDAVEALRLCDVVDVPALADAARQGLLSCLVFSGRYRDARALIAAHAEAFSSPLRRPDFVLRGVGLARYSNGDVDRALGDFEAALPLAREAGDVQHELVLMGLLGLMRHERGELDDAKLRFDEALARAELEGDTYLAAVLRNWRAQVLLERGEPEKALIEFAVARQALGEAGDTRFLRAVEGYRGVTFSLLGRYDEAAASLEACVESARGSHDAYRLAHFLPHLAFALRERGQVSRAAALFTEARELASASAHPNLEPVALLLDEGLAHPAAARLARGRAASSSDVRLAWRLAGRRVPAPEPRLEVDPEGRFFLTPDGRRVSLLKRRPLMRIAAALARRADDGLGLTTLEVLREGWPGEAPQGRSGLQRVYVAINTLRKLGLDVTGGPEGYRLER